MDSRHHEGAGGPHGGSRAHARAYGMLALNLILSGVAMYLVMFTMIDALRSFHNNLNMAYMAVMMVAPMAVLMVLMMPAMYPRRWANAGIVAACLGLFALAFAFMRLQTGIGDDQFLRSMIPHHSGAILMCREADLRDAEIRALCASIMKSQRAEIDQMEAILARRRAAR
jgi:uncharacterized protein (DUF305 family)